jgi:Cu-processing system permease protein
VQDFARTAASLVQLVLLLVPLTSLLTGIIALAPERGAAELLFSQPVSRRAVLIGKLLGLFAALVAAQAIGFGAAGAVIFSQSGQDGLGGFLLVGAGSVALTAVFLGLSALIATGSPGANARVLWHSDWSPGSSPSCCSTSRRWPRPRSCARAAPRASLSRRRL